TLCSSEPVAAADKPRVGNRAAVPDHYVYYAYFRERRSGTADSVYAVHSATLSLGRGGEYHGRGAGRRHRAARRPKAPERRSQRVRAAHPEQDSVHQPAVQERRLWP